jgi:hypothetical protein
MSGETEPAAGAERSGEPGVVAVHEWRPGPEAVSGTRSGMWGGVARKP